MDSGKLEKIKEHLTTSDIINYTKVAENIATTWSKRKDLQVFNTQSKFMGILLLMERYYSSILLSKADLATRMMDGGGSYDGHISFINECCENETFYEFTDVSDKRKKFIVPNRHLIQSYENYIKDRIMVSIGAVHMIQVADFPILSEVKWEKDIDNLLVKLNPLPLPPKKPNV